MFLNKQLYVNIQKKKKERKEMARFQDMVKVAEMSGKKFMENVLSNPIFQKERTALDYFCVVFLILKQCSSSM